MDGASGVGVVAGSLRNNRSGGDNGGVVDDGVVDGGCVIDDGGSDRLDLNLSGGADHALDDGGVDGGNHAVAVGVGEGSVDQGRVSVSISCGGSGSSREKTDKEERLHSAPVAETEVPM